MEITIKPVCSKKELKAFVRFKNQLYNAHPYAVPDLEHDLFATLDKKKNAAFEFCEAEYFLAYRAGKIVGRAAAIINHKANGTWNQKCVRFGWIDFIDDETVSSKLIQSVEQWGKAKGMNRIQGPLGFTDFDPEGMLIEGFDQLGTMTTIYNYPYYPQHLEKAGFEKDADWIEYKIHIPETAPEKYLRVSEIVLQKHDLQIKKLTSSRRLRKEYGQAIFNLLNEAYESLFAYSALSEKQIDQYVNQYLPMLDLRMVTLVTNRENDLIAVGISMPSLSRALQKARGKILPLGWIHLVKALFLKRRSDTADLLLIAVKPDYQNKGINALLFSDLIPVYNALGFRFAESNPELEENSKVQSQWEEFETEQHKRRRVFHKTID